MSPVPERKLTTILAADVAGYSAGMDADEEGTLVTLKAYRAVIAEHIASRRGRIVNTAGDSLLAEFASVVNAVECAAGLQRELGERNAGLAEARRMRFRVGINLGDVMVEGEDLFGEGVNVAARLQALAEPGGILISGTVFDQVKHKLALGFDYLGPQAVKNIAETVPAWRVVLDSGMGANASSSAGEKAAAERPAADPPHVSPLGRFVAGAEQVSLEPKAPRPYRTPRQRLQRSAAIGGVLIAFFFAINMLSSRDSLWFQWPTLIILLVLGLRAAFAMGRQ